MRLFLTGGTGLVGRRLVVDRLSRGDQLVLLTRSAARASALFAASANPNVRIVEGNPRVPGAWQEAVSGCDAVVHLAGAGIADRRWTATHKRFIVDSRIDSTHQIVEAIRDAASPPRVLVSASAVGWYGDTGRREVDESGPAASDFLARLAAQWEETAVAARELGARTVTLRIGMVLDERGGALVPMIRPFRWFVGGPVGSGRQYVSWIHWRDLIGLVDLALSDGQLDGPLNATAPNPVTNRELARAIGAALGRPCWLPVPGSMVRLAIGELAKYVLMSQRVVPRLAVDRGYRFRFPEIGDALKSLLGGTAAERGTASAGPPAAVVATAPRAPSAGPAAPTEPGPKPAARIRLVAIGVDGAILRGKTSVPEGLIHACRAVQASECVVVLATARPPRSARGLVDVLEIVAPMITHGGATIWNPLENTAQYHEPLESRIARLVVERARAADPTVQIGIEILDKWFTDRLDPALQREFGPTLAPDATGDIDSFLDEPVTQLNLMSSADRLDIVREVLTPGLWADRAISIFRPEPTLLQVMHPLADQAVALQRIAQHLGTDQSEVLAIGCSAADAGMVDWAGFGVAVEDADERVRAVASAVVPSARQHGVTRALRRYVLYPDGDRTAESGLPVESKHADST